MRAIVFAASLLAAGCATAQSADVFPVVAAERAFAADFPALGLAGSFRKWSRPDSLMISEGQVRTVATVFAGAPLTRQPDEPLLEWWPNFAGIARSGDLGFTTGGVAVDGQRTGHYFTIWQRQADGSWKWVYDGGSGASAAEVPGPDSAPVILPVSDQGAGSAAAATAEVAALEVTLGFAALDSQKDTHLHFLADNGRLYVAPRPPAIGRAAFAEALSAWPEVFEFGLSESGGASAAGDLVWTYGAANWVADGQPATGHYVRLWQKQKAGWKIVLAQLIPAPPSPPPPGG